MSKNYDNWERLVRVVLRREHDRQLALAHSSTSSSSSSSSFSRLPDDYCDIELDHTDWKVMLPPGKQEAVWKSAHMSFSLDKRTGKNCFMVGAMKLQIPKSHEDYERHCKLAYDPKSRFSKVAEFVDSWKFFVRGSIKARMLSPDTFYDAYLVFKNRPSSRDKQGRVVVIYEWMTEQRKRQVAVHRADGWMEVKMIGSSSSDVDRKEEEIGEFYVHKGDNRDLKAIFRVETDEFVMTSGLIVEGIEFRPSKTQTKKDKGKKNGRRKGVFSNFIFKAR